jgi:hypothetical protein
MFCPNLLDLNKNDIFSHTHAYLMAYGNINWQADSRFVHALIKCTLVQTLSLCTGRTAQRGSRGIAPPFHDHGTRRGWGVSVTPRSLSTPGKDPVPTVQEAGWAPGPVWTRAENLAPTGIRSPDCPARSQSLYRLSYPHALIKCLKNVLRVQSVLILRESVAWIGVWDLPL